MTSPTLVRVLAISGSLRAKSINTAVLLTAQSLAPADLTVTIYLGLGALPHFNPDLDTTTPPATDVALRAAVDSADALLICAPEYAHGVPGTLKNALDWLVSYPSFFNKPRHHQCPARRGLRSSFPPRNSRSHECPLD